MTTEKETHTMGRVLVCLSCSELLFFCFWFVFALSCNCLHHCLVTKKKNERTYRFLCAERIDVCRNGELRNPAPPACFNTLNDGQAV